MNLKTTLALAAVAAFCAAPAFAQDAGVNPDGTTSGPIPYSQLTAADAAMAKVKTGGGHKAKAHKKAMHHKAKAPASAGGATAGGAPAGGAATPPSK